MQGFRKITSYSGKEDEVCGKLKNSSPKDVHILILGICYLTAVDVINSKIFRYKHYPVLCEWAQYNHKALKCDTGDRREQRRRREGYHGGVIWEG